MEKFRIIKVEVQPVAWTAYPRVANDSYLSTQLDLHLGRDISDTEQIIFPGVARERLQFITVNGLIMTPDGEGHTRDFMIKKKKPLEIEFNFGLKKNDYLGLMLAGSSLHYEPSKCGGEAPCLCLRKARINVYEGNPEASALVVVKLGHELDKALQLELRAAPNLYIKSMAQVFVDAQGEPRVVEINRPLNLTEGASLRLDLEGVESGSHLVLVLGPKEALFQDILDAVGL